MSVSSSQHPQEVGVTSELPQWGAQKVKKPAQEHTASQRRGPNSEPRLAGFWASLGRFCQRAASETPGAPEPASRWG